MAKITVLPLDLTGGLSSNYRTGEERKLINVPGKKNRMIAPKYGAYYKESLVVRDSTGKVLKEDVDYATTYYYEEIWDLCAKSACAIIVITNTAVKSPVRLTYQAVGGHYCFSVEELNEVLAEIEQYPENLGWDDIRNKPLQFVPEEHEHELWQIYGMESTVVNLDMIGTAWAVGRKGVLEDNRYYYRNVLDLAQKAVDDYSVQVMAHINNRDNPHKTDKIKIGLSEINNWGMATQAEGVTKTVANKYQPIGSVYDQLVTNVIPFYDAHVKNFNNPHNLLLSDPLINLYSSNEIRTKFNQRLRRVDPAYNTDLYGSQDQGVIYTSMRSNLEVNNVQANTLFPQDRLAPPIPGWNPDDYALAGNNTFVPISTLIRTFNDSQGSVYFIGAAALSSYDYLSVGTYAIRSTFVDFNDRRQTYILSVYIRTAGGWSQLL